VNITGEDEEAFKRHLFQIPPPKEAAALLVEMEALRVGIAMLGIRIGSNQELVTLDTVESCLKAVDDIKNSVTVLGMMVDNHQYRLLGEKKVFHPRAFDKASKLVILSRSS